MSEQINAAEKFAEQYEKIRAEIAKEMIGQAEVVEHLLLAVIAGGNVLLEGVPGLGKTHLVRVLGKVLDLPFSRIQFTPDLMPADITGTNILVRTEEGNAFRFQQGPLFSSIVLADEINRATPKTQAALLEAMQEHSVTVAGETREELGAIVDLTVKDGGSEAQRVIGAEDLLAMRAAARSVPIAASVQEYALRLVLATHPETPEAPEAAKKYLRFGASPRAAQALLSAARVRALAKGRYNVAYEDIRFAAPACLRHRAALNFEAVTAGKDMESVLADILAAVAEK